MTAEDIFSQFDEWVRTHGSGVYVPAKQGVDPPNYDPPVQQVREELREFVEVLVARNYHDSICEIGLGNHGGTHALWRMIFGRVLTVEVSEELVIRFNVAETQDGRSYFVVGNSNSPRTCRMAQAKDWHPFDVVVIDGDHRYDAVRMDWGLWHGFVRPSGIIALHDVLESGVMRLCGELKDGKVDGRSHMPHFIIHSDHVGFAWFDA